MSFDIFVSHSSKDSDFVRPFVELLEEKGFVCWVAPRNILSGEQWPAAISRGLRESSIMILLISKYSNESRPVGNEVERIFNQRKTIIPCFIEEVVLSDSLDYFLASSHFFKFQNKSIETATEELCRDILQILPQERQKEILDFRQKKRVETKKAQAVENEQEALLVKQQEETTYKQPEKEKPTAEEQLAENSEIAYLHEELQQIEKTKPQLKTTSTVKPAKIETEPQFTNANKKKWIVPIAVAGFLVLFLLYWFAIRDNRPIDQAFMLAQKMHTQEAYQNYIEEYPENYFVPEAKDSIESIDAQKLFSTCNTVAHYENFAAKYPAHRLAAVANDSIRNIKVKNDFEVCTTLLDYQSFIKNHTDSFYIKKAKQKIEYLQNAEAQAADIAAWDAAKSKNTVTAYQAYINQNPNSNYLYEAKQKIEYLQNAEAQAADKKEWLAAKSKNTIAAYKAYKTQYPSGAYVSEANAAIKELETPVDINIETVYVAGGTFQMGSTDGESDEKPLHSVTVSSFNIGKYEVTQAQWKAIMGSNPSATDKGIGDNYPVNHVSWDDIQTFIKKLNAKTGKTYRLPTEAEWEFAARGGNKSNGYTYAGSNTIGSVAWYDDNSGSKTHAVGGKSPNELGIYDMSGNVWEWCADWYSSDYYSSSPKNDPLNTKK